MGYIGNQASTNFSSLAKQVITGNGGATYTLTTPVANANELEIFVNNVRQEPAVAYTTNGTTLSMTGNVASTDDFYVVYQGKAVQTTVTPDGSVSTAKIADDAVTNAKIDTMAASKLTGALPAIDGSALTGLSAGLLQVVQTTTEAEKSTTSTSFVASGIYVNITPSSTSSKILISVGFTMGASPNGPPEYKLYRGTTALTNARMSFQADNNWNSTTDRGTIEVLDSPNTTALTTYQIYFKRNGTGAARIGRSADKTHATTSTYVTAMEIAG